MRQASALNAGYGGDQARPVMCSSNRPIDLVHLMRQTMGDRTLEAEVLALFSRQIEAARGVIATGDTPQRLNVAHSLKGTARGVGAFAIADCAAELEERPQDKEVVDRLARLIDESRAFISTISS